MMSVTCYGRTLAALLLSVTANGCSGEDAAPPDLHIDPGILLHRLSPSERSELCTWGVVTMGGAGREFEAPCLADALSADVPMRVMTITACIQSLEALAECSTNCTLRWKKVTDFETCVEKLPTGEGCYSGCITHAAEYVGF
jgi:hypothetical protein